MLIPLRHSYMSTIIIYDCLVILLYLTWAIFSGLRVYAISGPGRIPIMSTALVVALMLLTMAINLYETDAITGVSVYFISATTTLGSENDRYPGVRMYKFNAAASSSLIVGDLMVLVMTWRKTYSLRKHATEANTRSPLIIMLLRDGNLHFLAMCILNITSLIMREAPVDMNVMVIALTAIIVSRFFLNLRDIKDYPNTSTGNDVEASAPWVSNLRFTSAIVGNMGAELNGSFGIGTRVDDPDEEDEEDARRFEDTGRIEEVPRSPVAELAP